MRKLFICILLCLLTLPLCAEEQIEAFPGAEGFGRYTSGGRGGSVYHVTTLEDNETAPTRGMLRYALNQSGARTIVFDVCGTIHLKSTMRISNGNVTIAGQSAPGDGICIADYPVEIRCDNIIMRYLRFRLGNLHVDQHEGDGLGSMDHDNIMIDHCSISWSIDECCSVYGGSNITVQWCLISQSLRNSGHSKGAHGYGGNWGGSGCSYIHNLLCHHESRTPRLGPRPGTQTDERLDLRNNVIYNWAGNGCYGGEGMNVNIVNNYYKAGPATKKKSTAIQERIAAINIRTTDYCTNDDGSWNGWAPMWHVWGKYYVDGNYFPGSSRVTADNWTYGIYAQINASSNDGTYTSKTKDTIRLSEPFDFYYTTTFTPEVAYSKVLDYAGCIKLRNNKIVRDWVDSLMVSDTRNGVASYGNSNNMPGIIDSQNDNKPKGAGADWSAWPNLTATATEISRASLDTDGDGIPDYYSDLFSMNKKGNEYEKSTQYTNLEYYLNQILQTKITKPCTSDGIVLGVEAGALTGIESIESEPSTCADFTTVYNLYGVPARNNVSSEDALVNLPKGIYVYGGRKIIVK